MISKGKGKATPWAGMAEASEWALPCEDQRLSWFPQDDLPDSDPEDNKMPTGEEPPAIVTAIWRHYEGKGTSNLPTPSSAGSNAVNAAASRPASSSRPPPKKRTKISEGPPHNPEEGEDEEFERSHVRFRRLNALQQKLQQGAVAGQKASQQKKEMLGELHQKKEKIAEKKKEMKEKIAEIGEHGEQLHQQMKQLIQQMKKLEMDEEDVDEGITLVREVFALVKDEGEDSEEGESEENRDLVQPEQLNFADTDRFTEIIPGQVYYDRLMHSFLEKEKGKGVFRRKVLNKGDKGKCTGKTLEERWKTGISEDWVHEKVYQPNCMRCDELGVGHGHESPCQACGAILRSTTLEEARDWEKALELRAKKGLGIKAFELWVCGKKSDKGKGTAGKTWEEVILWAEGGKVQDGKK